MAEGPGPGVPVLQGRCRRARDAFDGDPSRERRLLRAGAGHAPGRGAAGGGRCRFRRAGDRLRGAALPAHPLRGSAGRGPQPHRRPARTVFVQPVPGPVGQEGRVRHAAGAGRARGLGHGPLLDRPGGHALRQHLHDHARGRVRRRQERDARVHPPRVRRPRQAGHQPRHGRNPVHPVASRLRPAPRDRRHGAVPPVVPAGRRQEAAPVRRRGRLVPPRQPHHQLRGRTAPRIDDDVPPSPAAVPEHRCRAQLDGADLGAHPGRTREALPESPRRRPAGRRAEHREHAGHHRRALLRRPHAAVHRPGTLVRHPRDVPHPSAGAGVAVAAGGPPGTTTRPSSIPAG